ncbi:hypothetical protein [Pilimelia columellifera]|uniref:HlyD family secretion protein n=1 Tax=Pilimelia columellifera subsp. columellifera TaxID=706583 RepID=A0ABN3NPB4_9ACTN
MSRTLFRSNAMARNAGPEKLDERIRVVTVKGWIALAVGVIVAASLLGWAALGTTREQVSGSGLLVREPYTFTAESPVYGFVEKPPPAPGTRVTQGQHIAVVRNTEDPASPPVPVLAPITGTLISVAAERGTVVVRGQDVAYLEVATGPLVAQVFVPTAEGKRITSGMDAQIEPSTAPAASYGRMLSVVTAVSDYSLSADRIRTVVGHSSLAESIIDGPPVLLVTLALRQDPVTGDHLWTSGDGPSFNVGSGTLAEGTVTLSTSRPLDIIFGRNAQ